MSAGLEARLHHCTAAMRRRIPPPRRERGEKTWSAGLCGARRIGLMRDHFSGHQLPNAAGVAERNGREFAITIECFDVTA